MQVTIEIPDNVAQSAELAQSELLQEIAIVLFQQERITLGKAAQIAKMHSFEFQRLLASRDLCIHYGLEEYRTDLQSLHENNWR